MRLLAKGLALAADLEALDAGVKRFIGRHIDRSVGHIGPDGLKSGGWPANSSPDEKEFRAEYKAYVCDGDLWPADEETAAMCGVDFDPSFGGEYDADDSDSDL